MRYFSDGVAFGSKEFVESVFEKNRLEFGVKRKAGARKPKVHGALDGPYSMRDLRLRKVSVPKKAA